MSTIIHVQILAPSNNITPIATPQVQPIVSSPETTFSAGHHTHVLFSGTPTPSYTPSSEVSFSSDGDCSCHIAWKSPIVSPGGYLPMDHVCDRVLQAEVAHLLSDEQCQRGNIVSEEWYCNNWILFSALLQSEQCHHRHMVQQEEQQQRTVLLQQREHHHQVLFTCCGAATEESEYLERIEERRRSHTIAEEDNMYTCITTEFVATVRHLAYMSTLQLLQNECVEREKIVCLQAADWLQLEDFNQKLEIWTRQQHLAFADLLQAESISHRLLLHEEKQSWSQMHEEHKKRFPSTSDLLQQYLQGYNCIIKEECCQSKALYTYWHRITENRRVKTFDDHMNSLVKEYSITRQDIVQQEYLHCNYLLTEFAEATGFGIGSGGSSSNTPVKKMITCVNMTPTHATPPTTTTPPLNALRSGSSSKRSSNPQMYSPMNSICSPYTTPLHVRLNQTQHPLSFPEKRKYLLEQEYHIRMDLQACEEQDRSSLLDLILYTVQSSGFHVILAENRSRLEILCRQMSEWRQTAERELLFLYFAGAQKLCIQERLEYDFLNSSFKERFISHWNNLWQELFMSYESSTIVMEQQETADRQQLMAYHNIRYVCIRLDETVTMEGLNRRSIVREEHQIVTHMQLSNIVRLWGMVTQTIMTEEANNRRYIVHYWMQVLHDTLLWQYSEGRDLLYQLEYESRYRLYHWWNSSLYYVDALTSFRLDSIDIINQERCQRGELRSAEQLSYEWIFKRMDDERDTIMQHELLILHRYCIHQIQDIWKEEQLQFDEIINRREWDLSATAELAEVEDITPHEELDMSDIDMSLVWKDGNPRRLFVDSPPPIAQQPTAEGSEKCDQHPQHSTSTDSDSTDEGIYHEIADNQEEKAIASRGVHHQGQQQQQLDHHHLLVDTSHSSSAMQEEAELLATLDGHSPLASTDQCHRESGENLQCVDLEDFGNGGYDEVLHYDSMQYEHYYTPTTTATGSTVTPSPYTSSSDDQKPVVLLGDIVYGSNSPPSPPKTPSVLTRSNGDMLPPHAAYMVLADSLLQLQASYAMEARNTALIEQQHRWSIQCMYKREQVGMRWWHGTKELCLLEEIEWNQVLEQESQSITNILKIIDWNIQIRSVWKLYIHKFSEIVNNEAACRQHIHAYYVSSVMGLVVLEEHTTRAQLQYEISRNLMCIYGTGFGQLLQISDGLVSKQEEMQRQDLYSYFSLHKAFLWRKHTLLHHEEQERDEYKMHEQQGRQELQQEFNISYAPPTVVAIPYHASSAQITIQEELERETIVQQRYDELHVMRNDHRLVMFGYLHQSPCQQQQQHQQQQHQQQQHQQQQQQRQQQQGLLQHQHENGINKNSKNVNELTNTTGNSTLLLDTSEITNEVQDDDDDDWNEMTTSTTLEETAKNCAMGTRHVSWNPTHRLCHYEDDVTGDGVDADAHVCAVVGQPSTQEGSTAPPLTTVNCSHTYINVSSTEHHHVEHHPLDTTTTNTGTTPQPDNSVNFQVTRRYISTQSWIDTTTPVPYPTTTTTAVTDNLLLVTEGNGNPNATLTTKNTGIVASLDGSMMEESGGATPCGVHQFNRHQLTAENEECCGDDDWSVSSLTSTTTVQQFMSPLNESRENGCCCSCHKHDTHHRHHPQDSQQHHPQHQQGVRLHSVAPPAAAAIGVVEPIPEAVCNSQVASATNHNGSPVVTNTANYNIVNRIQFSPPTKQKGELADLYKELAALQEEHMNIQTQLNHCVNNTHSDIISATTTEKSFVGDPVLIPGQRSDEQGQQQQESTCLTLVSVSNNVRCTEDLFLISDKSDGREHPNNDTSTITDLSTSTTTATATTPLPLLTLNGPLTSSQPITRYDTHFDPTSPSNTIQPTTSHLQGCTPKQRRGGQQQLNGMMQQPSPTPQPSSSPPMPTPRDPPLFFSPPQLSNTSCNTTTSSSSSSSSLNINTSPSLYSNVNVGLSASHSTPQTYQNTATFTDTSTLSIPGEQQRNTSTSPLLSSSRINSSTLQSIAETTTAAPGGGGGGGGSGYRITPDSYSFQNKNKKQPHAIIYQHQSHVTTPRSPTLRANQRVAARAAARAEAAKQYSATATTTRLSSTPSPSASRRSSLSSMSKESKKTCNKIRKMYGASTSDLPKKYSKDDASSLHGVHSSGKHVLQNVTNKGNMEATHTRRHSCGPAPTKKRIHDGSWVPNNTNSSNNPKHTAAPTTRTAFMLSGKSRNHSTTESPADMQYNNTTMDNFPDTNGDTGNNGGCTKRHNGNREREDDISSRTTTSSTNNENGFGLTYDALVKSINNEHTLDHKPTHSSSGTTEDDMTSSTIMSAHHSSSFVHHMQLLSSQYLSQMKKHTPRSHSPTPPQPTTIGPLPCNGGIEKRDTKTTIGSNSRAAAAAPVTTGGGGGASAVLDISSQLPAAANNTTTYYSDTQKRQTDIHTKMNAVIGPPPSLLELNRANSHSRQHQQHNRGGSSGGSPGGSTVSSNNRSAHSSPPTKNLAKHAGFAKPPTSTTRDEGTSSGHRLQQQQPQQQMSGNCSSAGSTSPTTTTALSMADISNNNSSPAVCMGRAGIRERWHQHQQQQQTALCTRANDNINNIAAASGGASLHHHQKKSTGVPSRRSCSSGQSSRSDISTHANLKQTSQLHHATQGNQTTHSGTHTSTANQQTCTFSVQPQSKGDELLNMVDPRRYKHVAALVQRLAEWQRQDIEAGHSNNWLGPEGK